MNPAIVETLATLSDALATEVEVDQLPLAAAQAIPQALGCQVATIWLVVGNGRPRWLKSLEQVPGVERVMQKLWQNGSGAEDVQLQLASATHRRPRVWHRLLNRAGPGPTEKRWPTRTTLAALTGGQITTLAELAARRSHPLRLDTPGPDQERCLMAGLFRADDPIGVLVCTWASTDEATSPDFQVALMVCLANYLGPVLGDRSVLAPERDVYLAGTGLLLTALDVGPPVIKERAEALTYCALRKAAESALRPAEVQSLQWAALFHEVGQAPMDRWVTFPPPSEEELLEAASDHRPCLTLIPALQPAADLLSQVAPVLNGQTGDLDPDLNGPAKLLAEAWLTTHSRCTQPADESAMLASDHKSIQTQEPWDTDALDTELSIPEDLDTPALQAA